MEELFKSTHDALIFAFHYSSQQYAITPMAKMMKTGFVGTGKGLVSLDGAAQAGIIKAEVERLPSIYRSCIIARYSAKYEACKCCGGDRLISEYDQALANLSEAATRDGWVTGLSVRGMRRGIIQAFYEKKVKVANVADDLGIPRRTAYDQKARITKRLKELDSDAQAIVGDGLMSLFEIAEPLVVAQEKPKFRSTKKKQVEQAVDTVECVECHGEPSKLAIAFHNTGEDGGEHTCASVTIECQLCGGAGQITPAVAQRHQSGRRHRENRMARRETLFAAAQRLDVRPAELSAYEHGYRDFPQPSKKGELYT